MIIPPALGEILAGYSNTTSELDYDGHSKWLVKISN